MAEELLWEGISQSLTAKATGGAVVGEKYRVTDEYIFVSRGILSTNAEQYPLWAVRDMDIICSIMQKARKVEDLRIRLEANDYTGVARIVLKDITGAAELRDLLNKHSQHARLLRQQQQQTVHYSGVPTAQPLGVAASSGQPEDTLDQLKKLGELLTAGVLTTDEFAAHKAKLLGQPAASVAPAAPPSAPVPAAVMIAGWHADPSGKHELRHHDGAQWTEHVFNAGVQAVDPL